MSILGNQDTICKGFEDTFKFRKHAVLQINPPAELAGGHCGSILGVPLTDIVEGILESFVPTDYGEVSKKSQYLNSYAYTCTKYNRNIILDVLDRLVNDDWQLIWSDDKSRWPIYFVNMDKKIRVSIEAGCHSFVFTFSHMDGKPKPIATIKIDIAYVS